MATSSINFFSRSLAESLPVIRKMLAPILLIQIIAASLVIGYFRSSAIQASADQLAAIKVQFGVGFAFLAGMIAGGILPEVAKLVTGKFRPDVKRIAWTTFAYGIIGVIEDSFFLFLSKIVANDSSVRTVLLKVLIDFALFSPFLIIPVTSALINWYAHNFRLSFWKEAFSKEFYINQVWKDMPLCWTFWLPMLFCMYSLPLNLQLPFAMMLVAIWSIVYVSVKLDVQRVGDQPVPIA